jgi:hypothetical protein
LKDEAQVAMAQSNNASNGEDAIVEDFNFDAEVANSNTFAQPEEREP